MTDHDKAARRTVLRAGLATLAAGVAANSFPANSFALPAGRRVLAQDKLAQEAVQYQNQPKDGAKCSLCVNFVAPNACQIVSGNISPDGWCIAYGPKSG